MADNNMSYEEAGKKVANKLLRITAKSSTKTLAKRWRPCEW